AFLAEFVNENIKERELQKVVNKICNYIAFTNEPHVNKAFNLAYFKMIDAMHLYNNEQETYQKVNTKDVQRVAQEVFRAENCSTLYYQKKNNE
ncbi:MAG: insulinase family protein, partial [Bacteroidetes bacterium]|nr:insulinase family protein [Bacteroidota bacterium]